MYIGLCVLRYKTVSLSRAKHSRVRYAHIRIRRSYRLTRYSYTQRVRLDINGLNGDEVMQFASYV